MNINIPKLIKKYGSEFLKNPDAPLNLNIDRITKGDGKGSPKRVQTKDGFKLGKFPLQHHRKDGHWRLFLFDWTVYPGDQGFDVDISEEAKKGETMNPVE